MIFPENCARVALQLVETSTQRIRVILRLIFILQAVIYSLLSLAVSERVRKTRKDRLWVQALRAVVLLGGERGWDLSLSW